MKNRKPDDVLKCVAVGENSSSEDNEEFQSFLRAWSMAPSSHLSTCVRIGKEIEQTNRERAKCLCFEGLGSVM